MKGTVKIEQASGAPACVWMLLRFMCVRYEDEKKVQQERVLQHHPSQSHYLQKGTLWQESQLTATTPVLLELSKVMRNTRHPLVGQQHKALYGTGGVHQQWQEHLATTITFQEVTSIPGVFQLDEHNLMFVDNLMTGSRSRCGRSDHLEAEVKHVNHVLCEMDTASCIARVQPQLPTGANRPERVDPG